MAAHSSVSVEVVPRPWRQDLPALSYCKGQRDLVAPVFVRAQVALELVSEKVVFTIFRVSIKRGK